MSNMVAVDLETLGTHNGAIIVSIGAVRFDSDRGVPLNEYTPGTDDFARFEAQNTFYRECSVASNTALGLTFANDTMAWWMDQAGAVQQTLKNALRNENVSDIRQVLSDFKAWLELQDTKEMWAWHSPFDFGMLKTAYQRCGESKPWDYRKEMCAFTLAKAIPNVPKPQLVGVSHNALDDAKWCARYVTSLKNYMLDAHSALAQRRIMQLQRESGPSNVWAAGGGNGGAAWGGVDSMAMAYGSGGSVSVQAGAGGGGASMRDPGHTHNVGQQAALPRTVWGRDAYGHQVSDGGIHDPQPRARDDMLDLSRYFADAPAPIQPGSWVQLGEDECAEINTQSGPTAASHQAGDDSEEQR